jgi:diguanylate cyclase (GGDEF)-like protein
MVQLTRRSEGSDTQTGRPPLILIVDDQEWSARALETILTAEGYGVTRATSGAEALTRAAAERPDGVLIDIGLPDMSGLEVCRRLIEHPAIGPTTPIIATTADGATRSRRLEAYRAGAWDFLPLPPDARELLAKLQNWIAARREYNRARDEGMLDAASGLYNTRGLRQRAAELIAEALRYDKPLACVVITVERAAPTGPAAEAGDMLVARAGEALRSTLRTYDAVGRITADQFAVLAPSTDPSGAQRLAQRAIETIDSAIRSEPSFRAATVEAGLFAVPNLRSAKVAPADLFARAASAVRLRQHPISGHARIFEYELSP